MYSCTEGDGRCGYVGTGAGVDGSELRTLVVAFGVGTVIGVVFRRGHSKRSSERVSGVRM